MTNLVHMVIDEAAALGHHQVIDDMLNMGRGYGLRVHLFFQNAAQLMRCYPDGQHQAVMGTTTNVFFAAHDWVTCEEISKRSGSATIVVESGGDGDGDSRQSSEGSGGGSVGSSRNRSRNWSFAGKPLIRPEQVAALPERVAITFAPGVGAPVLTWLTRYYEESPPAVRLARAWAAAKALLRPLLLAAVSVSLAATAAAVRVEPPVLPDRPVRRPVRINPPPARPAATPTTNLKGSD